MMIHTSRQLKDLVRNMSGGDSTKAQIIIRNYVMERFLERLSLSPYRNNCILKGGVLVSAIVGLENRSTMDIDATIKNLPLSLQSVQKVVNEITSVELDDGMTFEIKNISTIMDEMDYAGIRIVLDTILDSMRTTLKIDLSTGDVITPSEISYSYKLLFENRTISILAYNLETVLAEKLETILSRGTANTRMRDFYDVHALENTHANNIDLEVLRAAFQNTCYKLGSFEIVRNVDLILDEIESDRDMEDLWESYKRKFEYAAEVMWDDTIKSVRNLCNECKLRFDVGYDLSL